MMGIRHQFLTCAVVISSTLITALPSPNGTKLESTTINTPPDIKSQEVGWQSIFWALFALAVQAMAFPSVLDKNKVKSRLLFPARASPIVCFTDTLEALFYFIRGLQKTSSSRRAASLACLWQLQVRSRTTNVQYQDVLDVSIRQHPKASAVLLLGVLSQFIKLMGMEGIVLPKIIAGTYLIAYLVPAILLLMAKDSLYEEISLDKGFNSRMERETSRLPSQIAMISTVFTVGCCCNMLGQVLAKLDKGHHQDLNGAMRWILDVTNLCGAVMLGMSRMAACSIVAMLLICFVCVVVIIVNVRYFNLVVLLAIIAVAPIFYFIQPWLSTAEPSSFVLDTATGVAPIVTLYSAMLLTYQLLAILVGMIVHVLGGRFRCTDNPSKTLLAIIYLVTAAVYYAYGYDSKGTNKPQWTESLG